MKKIIIAFELCLVLILGMCGCTGNKQCSSKKDVQAELDNMAAKTEGFSATVKDSKNTKNGTIYNISAKSGSLEYEYQVLAYLEGEKLCFKTNQNNGIAYALIFLAKKSGIELNFEIEDVGVDGFFNYEFYYSYKSYFEFQSYVSQCFSAMTWINNSGLITDNSDAAASIYFTFLHYDIDISKINCSYLDYVSIKNSNPDETTPRIKYIFEKNTRTLVMGSYYTYGWELLGFTSYINEYENAAPKIKVNDNFLLARGSSTPEKSLTIGEIKRLLYSFGTEITGNYNEFSFVIGETTYTMGLSVVDEAGNLAYKIGDSPNSFASSDKTSVSFEDVIKLFPDIQSLAA